MANSKAWLIEPPYMYIVFFYFAIFQMSAISRFWPTVLKLGCKTNFDLLSFGAGFSC